MSKKKGSFLKFVSGVGIGVGMGMLLAPKSGAELRKDLKKKMDELLKKVKEIDIKEVSDEFVKKIDILKKEIEDLDREKVLEIAKNKGEQLKVKANELLDLAKEKGTPVVEKAVQDVRQKAIQVTKEVLKKLEESESKEKED